MASWGGPRGFDPRDVGMTPPPLNLASASADAVPGHARGPICWRCGNPLKMGEATPPIGLDDPAFLLGYGVLHPGCRKSLIRERMRASERSSRSLLISSPAPR